MVGRGIMFSKGELLNHGTSKVSSFRGSQAPGSAPARTSGEQIERNVWQMDFSQEGHEWHGTNWDILESSVEIN